VISHPPGTLELYQLESDPVEENNLAGEHPGLVEELLDLMTQEREESPIFPLKPNPNPE
jgi:arylsulfatase